MERSSIMPLSVIEEDLLAEIVLQDELERVAPKLEAFRAPAPYKVACGGRGAGAKSMSIASLLVQKMERGEINRWLCAREIQNTLEESSFNLIWETIERLRYKGWRQVPSTSKIINDKTGAYFKFAGFKDIKTAKGKKSLQNYDGCWIEECEDIPTETWDIVIPSFRKDTSEIWASFNRNRDADPVYKMFFVNPPEGTIAIELLPGLADNPWFPAILQRQLEHDYATRPDVAEHKWGGKPKGHGEDAVHSRVRVRQASLRNITEPHGATELGIDVARFGDDSTTIYKRHGFKVVEWFQFYGQDTMKTSKIAWAMAGRREDIRIKVDATGLGSAVVDKLRELGSKRTIAIHFGGNANDQDKYDSLASEMWFSFPVDEADIPDDEELLDELTDRRYTYDKAGCYVLEKKDIFKKRFGRSCDRADGLILCFYEGSNMKMSDELKAKMKNRRRAGR